MFLECRCYPGQAGFVIPACSIGMKGNDFVADHRYVELFAGCGGLSLGLRAAGWTNVLANELSPMAAETYAFNLLSTDVRSEEFARRPVKDRSVYWLKSAFASSDVVARLSENPLTEIAYPHSDIDETESGALDSGALIIGDIRALNGLLEKYPGMLPSGIDLVAGGPPCQSFSMAGARQLDNPRNQLPFEFARYVRIQKPKFVLLENVAGILRPFTQGGHEYHAWFEVSKEFALAGYVPLSFLLNAKEVGVPQSRPRFVLFGIRRDLFDSDQFAEVLGDWANPAQAIFDAVQSSNNAQSIPLSSDAMLFWDLSQGWKPNFDSTSKVGALIRDSCEPKRTVQEAIGDLEAGGVPSLKTNYTDYLEEQLSFAIKHPIGYIPSIENLEQRSHTPRVQARFALLQVLALSDPEIRRRGYEFLKSKTREVRGIPLELDPQWREVVRFVYKNRKSLLPFNGINRPTSLRETAEYVQALHTKKMSQRALIATDPAPTTLSIPDDYCHYVEPRTLSVRECARIQSFPDSFVFRGIPTTGGARRSYQVPQYTQVGNAVPPILGKVMGRILIDLVV